jgi:hypothetical protein
MRDAVRERQKHAELRLVLESGTHHFEITRLEDVQREVRAGKKNDV